MNTTDPQERARVRSRIGSLILEFCRRTSILQDNTFHMEDLRWFVEREGGGTIAPDSAGRVLRFLRQKGEVNYEVVSRSKSLYQVKPVERPAEQAELFARAS